MLDGSGPPLSFATADDIVYMFHVAQEIGRHQDLIPLARRLISASQKLDQSQRVAFSQAYHESVDNFEIFWQQYGHRRSKNRQSSGRILSA